MDYCLERLGAQTETCDPSMMLISIDLLRNYYLYSQNNNKKVGYLSGLVFGMIRGINSDMWPFHDVNLKWPT